MQIAVNFSTTLTTKKDLGKFEALKGLSLLGSLQEDYISQIYCHSAVKGSMVTDSTMRFVKDVAIAWIAGRENDLGSITMDFVDMLESSIMLQVNDWVIEIIVPSSFHIEGDGSSLFTSSDEVFLVTSAGCNSDESFQNMLMTLNEKLERVAIRPAAFSEVLDYLLLALQKYVTGSSENIQKGCKEDDKRMQLECESSVAEGNSGGLVAYDSDNDEILSGAEEGEDCLIAVDSDDDSSPDDYGYDLAAMENFSNTNQIHCNSTGFLCTMAELARLQCELAREAFEGKESDSTASIQSDYLRWCHVGLDIKSLTVSLLIHVGGIVQDDNLASALGIYVDTPIRIGLLFDKNIWVQRDFKPSKFLDVECRVTQEAPLWSKSLAEESDGQLHSMLSHSYGKTVLVPKLVNIYFHFLAHGTIVWEEKPKSHKLFDELHRFTSMENVFVGLLCFLCARMMALQNWCVVCWNALPYSVCRLCTCDKDLCLFTFEELGVGAPVLQEVQNSPEVIDFELSLAMVASESRRDVFEPFPTFLLEKEQIRGRSGWFSKVENIESSSSTQMAGCSSSAHIKMTESFSSNKNMSMLKAVLQSYPSVDIMQKCRDEDSLRVTLNEFWERNRKPIERKQHEEPSKSASWSKVECLPYSVLRYVLSTSRLKLHPLKGDELLPGFDAHYQFAVLHDSPEREAYFEERRHQQRGSFFAFHGSSADNWYSILRNGLRSLSNTSLMTTGASYGSGIYLGKQLRISLPYCVFKGPGWNHGILKDGFSVVAICEVIRGSVRHEEINDSANLRSTLAQAYSYGIMVVPPEHEKDVAIRYIIVLKPQTNEPASLSIDGTIMSEGIDWLAHSKSIDLLKHHQARRFAYSVQREELRRVKSKERIQYMSELDCQSQAREAKSKEASTPAVAEKVTEESLGHVSSSGNPPLSITSKLTTSMGASKSAMQAIAREYKNIMKQTAEAKEKKALCPDDDVPVLAGLEVILPDEDDICRWHVNLSQSLFKKFPLYKDLVECARLWSVPEAPVKLECTFKDTYPFAPPFVRVVSPRFRFHTGHVTIGGSICMELLTESGWNPVYTFESLIVQVVNAMIEGDGRIDMNAALARAEYGENEARRAFDRVARDHGWTR